MISYIRGLVADSVSRRMMKGLSAHGLMQLLSITTRFLEIPIFISAWGAATYGEWLMLTAIPFALAISDGGFSKTARREMTIRSGQGDFNGVESVFQTSWFALIFIFASASAVLFFVFSFFSLGDGLSLGGLSSVDVLVVLSVLCFGVFINFQSSLLYGVFSSRLEYSVAELHMVGIFGLSFLFMVIAVQLGGGVYEAAISYVAGLSVGFVVMYSNVVFRTKNLWFGFRFVDFSLMRKMASPSFYSLAFPLGEAINMQGARLIVGSLLGPQAVVYFSTMRTLCRSILQPVLAVSKSAEPEISMAFGRGDIELVSRIYKRAARFALIFSVALVLLVSVGAQIFYEFWTKGAFDFSWSFYLLLVASSVFAARSAVSVSVPCALNKPRYIAISYLLIQGVGVGLLMYFIICQFGVLGAAITFVIIDAIFALVAGRHVRHLGF